MGKKNNKVIGIIDYGMGNINAFKNIYNENGIDTKIINNFDNFDTDIKKIILPGVGSFDYAIQSLKSNGLLERIERFIKNPDNFLLGICLGMQILCLKSEEGSENGMGIFNKKIKKFNNISIPHLGWNTVNILKEDLLLNDIPNNSEFYFLHSFYLENDDSEFTVCSTNYNHLFSSIIKKNNVYGIQFHPEKSHKSGEKILINFYNI